jgi:peroxiredoxin
MTSSEASISAVMEFAQANRLRFPVLLDRAGLVAAAYKVSAVPTTYVISATGMIVAKQVGAMSPSWLRSRVASALR